MFLGLEPVAVTATTAVVEPGALVGGGVKGEIFLGSRTASRTESLVSGLEAPGHTGIDAISLVDEVVSVGAAAAKDEGFTSFEVMVVVESG